jgi:hypothetical protein
VVGNTYVIERELGGGGMSRRELGQGGMATVYLAHDLRHERTVAPDLRAVTA